GSFYDFWERAPSRLDNRHARSHRLEQRHALWLIVSRRNRQRVKSLQERDLRFPIKHAPIMKLFAKPPIVHLTLDRFEVIVMLGGEVAGDLQSDSPLGRSLSEKPICVA